jgi:DnaJ-class molecular chaperone
VIAAILMLLAGTGGGGWWWWNAHHRQTKPCPKCDGEKYVPARTLTSAERFKQCPKCDGTGRTLKWQARRAHSRQQGRPTGRRVAS